MAILPAKAKAVPRKPKVMLIISVYDINDYDFDLTVNEPVALGHIEHASAIALNYCQAEYSKTAVKDQEEVRKARAAAEAVVEEDEEYKEIVS